jgi:ribonuclease HI
MVSRRTVKQRSKRYFEPMYPEVYPGHHPYNTRSTYRDIKKHTRHVEKDYQRKRITRPGWKIHINMLRIYTDGSCVNNGRKNSSAGYGVVYPEQLADSWGAPLESGTNQAAELRAIFEGLVKGKTLMGDPSEVQVRVYTDSEFSINCLTKWVSGWKKKGWVTAEGKPVVHRVIIEQILEELSEYSGHVFTHVKAHTGGVDEHSKWNQFADDLARKAVETQAVATLEDLKTKVVRGESTANAIEGIPLALMGPPISETALFDALSKNLGSIDQGFLKSALISAFKKTLQLRNYCLEKSKLYKAVHYRLVEESHLTVVKVIKEEQDVDD